MGGRCDQENDRQKDGAAERRMNDFEYMERKKTEWRMWISSGGRNEGKGTNLLLHWHLCLSVVSVSAKNLPRCSSGPLDTHSSSVTQFSVVLIPISAGRDSRLSPHFLPGKRETLNFPEWNQSLENGPSLIWDRKAQILHPVTSNRLPLEEISDWQLEISFLATVQTAFPSPPYVEAGV